MIKFDSVDDVMELQHSAPGSQGSPAPFDDAARSWLASMGFELNESPGERTYTLLALGAEGSQTLEVYALPHDEVGEETRAAIATVHKTSYETLFAADLEPHCFEGAMWVLISTREGTAFEGVLDDIAEDAEDEDVTLDIDAARDAVGAWMPFVVESGATLAGSVVALVQTTYAP